MKGVSNDVSDVLLRLKYEYNEVQPGFFINNQVWAYYVNLPKFHHSCLIWSLDLKHKKILRLFMHDTIAIRNFQNGTLYTYTFLIILIIGGILTLTSITEFC